MARLIGRDQAICLALSIAAHATALVLASTPSLAPDESEHAVVVELRLLPRNFDEATAAPIRGTAGGRESAVARVSSAAAAVEPGSNTPLPRHVRPDAGSGVTRAMERVAAVPAPPATTDSAEEPPDESAADEAERAALQRALELSARRMEQGLRRSPLPPRESDPAE